MLGLALSALAKSSEQIMPLLVVAVMSQLVFSGGMIPVTDRLVLDQMSWVTPARWGYRGVGVHGGHHPPGARTADAQGFALGAHARAWLFDMGMLALLSVGYLTFVRFKIRLKAG